MKFRTYSLPAMGTTLAAALTIGWVVAQPDRAGAPGTLLAAPDTQAAASTIQQEERDKLVAQQQDAARAAVQQAGQEEFTAPVANRPAFVSPMEWDVLRRVAQQHPDSDRELTRMVNHLRFTKQLEHWTGLAAGDPLREELASHLLYAIPQRVSNRELNTDQAQALQATLLKEITATPEQYRQQLAREAARIGVTFEIHQAPTAP